MTQNEFNSILSSVKTLSPDQLRLLLRELQSWMSARAKPPAKAKPDSGQEVEATAFEVANRAGLIGCLTGAPRSPTDLSTNPKHMEGFGRE